MRITWVELKDFRNHRETRLEPPDGLCVAVGANGEGKTNLLEGMFYLLTMGSPRTSSDQPLVRRGASSAFIRGEVETASGRPLIEVEVRTTGANRVQVNRSGVRRRSDVRKLVRAVFFGPEDLAIVQADPDARRSFLDESVASLWPLKEGLARAYERALRQRNRLLKEWDGRGIPPGLEGWDVELVRTGTELTVARAEGARRVAPHATEEFRALSRYGLDVRYAPSVPADPDAGDPAGVERAFRDRLMERRPDELIRRTTLVGPHRDDLSLSVRDLGARSFASHGEAWGAALSLRLGLAAAVTAEVHDPPVLILDDPFSALDPERRGRVAGLLRGRGQTVISVADAGHVPEGAGVVWAIRDGAVSLAGPSPGEA